MRYKVLDAKRLQNEFHFIPEVTPTLGEILYLKMPHQYILIYVVLSEGFMCFERNMTGVLQSDDFELLDKSKYDMLEDYMKATRLISQLEFEKVIVGDKEDEAVRGTKSR
nr:MAG TPA: hypothetical protein [Caudoviricetes sp.]